MWALKQVNMKLFLSGQGPHWSFVKSMGDSTWKSTETTQSLLLYSINSLTNQIKPIHQSNQSNQPVNQSTNQLPLLNHIALSYTSGLKYSTVFHNFLLLQGIKFIKQIEYLPYLSSNCWLFASNSLWSSFCGKK